MSVSNLASHHALRTAIDTVLIRSYMKHLHCACFHFTYLDIIYCWSSYWGQREPRAGPRDSFGHSLTVTNTASLIQHWYNRKNIKKSKSQDLAIKGSCEFWLDKRINSQIPGSALSVVLCAIYQSWVVLMMGRGGTPLTVCIRNTAYHGAAA